MKRDIVHLITSYLNTHKNFLDSQVKIIATETHTLIYFCYRGANVEICVYNPTFIKIKVDKASVAICDGIKTVRLEIDRLHSKRY